MKKLLGVFLLSLVGALAQTPQYELVEAFADRVFSTTVPAGESFCVSAVMTWHQNAGDTRDIRLYVTDQPTQPGLWTIVARNAAAADFAPAFTDRDFRLEAGESFVMFAGVGFPVSKKVAMRVRYLPVPANAPCPK